MALILVAAGAWFGYKRLGGPSCSGETRLTVSATGEIAPAIHQAADAWVAGGASADGTCVKVDVYRNAGTLASSSLLELEGGH